MIGKAYIGLIVSVALAGCVSLLPKAGPGPDIYRLSSAHIDGQTTATQMVLLPLVQAPRELKNNRVVLIRGARSVVYAANARWAASSPEMLQSVLGNQLRADGRLGVSFPADGVDALFEMRVTLLNFEAQYDHGDAAAPLAVLGMRVQLIDRKTRMRIAEKSFRAVQRANGITLGEIVGAIDLATTDTAQQISNWTANRLGQIS